MPRHKRIKCKKCGKCADLHLYGSRAGQRMALHNLEGWSFTIDTGWICKSCIAERKTDQEGAQK